MKITMYELLGMVKDDKAPKTVKYRNEVFYYDEETKDYFNDEDMHYMFADISNKLDVEVEILKEEKGIPEQIECYHQYDECAVKDKFYQELKGSLVDEIIIDKINEIIDYLKSKGD